MSTIKTNSIIPSTGTALNIGESGDTVTVPTGASLVVTDGIAASSLPTTTVAKGGTNVTSFTSGDLLYATGATTLVKLAKGSAGQSLVMNSGASAPEWSNPASTVDLNPVTKAIAILALRDSVTENLTASSLNNSFIDTFQDSTGLGAQTNCGRQSGEFMKTTPSYGTAVYYRPHATGQLNGSTLSFSNTTGSGAHDSGGTSYAYADWTTSATGSGWWTLNADSTYQNGGRHTIIQECRAFPAGGGPYWGYGFNKNDGNNAGNAMNSKWNMTSATFNSGYKGVGKQLKTVYDPASDENNILGYFRDTNGDSWSDLNIVQYKNSAWDSTTLTSTGLFHAGKGSIDSGTHWTIRIWAAYEAATPNATGNFLSVATTASGTISEASLVVNYGDNVGTATLNTDIKGYVSANGGTNWTQVTLTAGPLFSADVKIATSDKVTIANTGTSMKYKIEWANQSVSKETRIYGVSLNY